MFIHKIKLKNFRKFRDLTLEFKKPTTIIQADNAKGKSTILEAIYLITNQSSPFTSDVANIMNFEQDEYYRIEADIETFSEKRNYAFFQQYNKKELILEKRKTIKKKFCENISSTIFSPEYIDLLMISPQHRRDFLDSVITSLNRDFEEISIKAKKVLKQRNSYLKKKSEIFFKTGALPIKDKILDYWTNLFAESSTQVIIERLKMIDKLSNNNISITYQPSFPIGLFQDMMSYEEILKTHKSMLEESIKKDVALGYTNLGSHRDDWAIFRGMNVRIHGSRGEKRLAIGELIFIIQDLRKKTNDYYPILLLDDISSELDDINTELIIDNALKDGQQTIITSIRTESIPKKILEISSVINLQ